MTITQKLARGLADIVYREIDVRLHPDVRFDRPTVCVANHFGGLADAVLIVDTLPVMPRIVARDVIWRIPVAGLIMRRVRAIPVHRRADGPATGAGNVEMFADCFAALAESDTILIFPEGVTQEEPHIAQVRTGAARIALGALEHGIADVQVVPVGVHYADKAGFRDAALVNVGAPIDVAQWWADHRTSGTTTQADTEPAHALTRVIDSALRAVAPDYPDWATCRDFELAAEVMLHDVDAGSLPVRYGDRSLIADRLAAHAGMTAADLDSTPPPTIPRRGAALLEAVADYRAHMRGLRAGDLAIRRVSAQRAPRSERNWLVNLILVALLWLYAVLGILMIAIPWLLVRLTKLARLAPAVQASVTPAVALLTFGLQWTGFVVRGWLNTGASGVFLGLVLPPFFVACAVFVVERLVLLARRFGVRRLSPSPKVAAAQGARQVLSDRAWELAS